MEEKELLNIVEYSLRFYRDEQLGNKFGLIEYYSLTDLNPTELSKLARKYKKISLCNSLSRFNDEFYWLRQSVKMEEKLTHFHSVNDHELTEEEKLTIYEKIQEENYPLIDGIYSYAARLLVTQGIEAISKDKIREKIMTAYNTAHGVKTEKNTKNKVLVK